MLTAMASGGNRLDLIENITLKTAYLTKRSMQLIETLGRLPSTYAILKVKLPYIWEPGNLLMIEYMYIYI